MVLSHPSCLYFTLFYLCSYIVPGGIYFSGRIGNLLKGGSGLGASLPF